MAVDAAPSVGTSPPSASAAAGTSASTGASTGTSASAPASHHGMSFGDVLSMLNPLQYVPVVGMIYRAVTGDTIPEPVRVAGGLAFSALTGGPVGVVLTAASDVAEEALGIDPDKIGHSLLASLGLAAPEAAPAKAATTLLAGQPAPAVASPRPASAAIASSAPAPSAPASSAPAPSAPAASAPASPANVSRRNVAYAWVAAETTIGSG